MMNHEQMNKRLYSLPFMQHELRLYLDTHPDDKRALDAYRRVCEAMGHCCCCVDAEMLKNGWGWIDDPWPWQAEANIIEGED